MASDDDGSVAFEMLFEFLSPPGGEEKGSGMSLGRSIATVGSLDSSSGSSPPPGGEVRRGGNDVRFPLSPPLPLVGERRKTMP
jgi:hypothetical protein